MSPSEYIKTLRQALKIAAVEAYHAEVALYEEGVLNSEGRKFFAIPMSEWQETKIDEWIKEAELDE